MDVEPDVEFRPVRKRKNTNAFTRINARVKNVPQLRALILRVPLSVPVTKRVDTLFGPRFFLVAARAAKRCIKPSLRQRIKQCSGFQEATALLRAQRKRVGASIQGFPILVNDQLGSNLPRIAGILWVGDRR